MAKICQGNEMIGRREVGFLGVRRGIALRLAVAYQHYPARQRLALARARAHALALLGVLGVYTQALSRLVQQVDAWIGKH